MKTKSKVRKQLKRNNAFNPKAHILKSPLVEYTNNEKVFKVIKVESVGTGKLMKGWWN